jgi:hypothetical protein
MALVASLDALDLGRRLLMITGRGTYGAPCPMRACNGRLANLRLVDPYPAPMPEVECPVCHALFFWNGGWKFLRYRTNA